MLMGFSEYESELKLYKYSLKSVNIFPWMIYTQGAQHIGRQEK